MMDPRAHPGLRAHATTWIARALAPRPRLGRYPGYHWLAGESGAPLLRDARRRFLKRAGGRFQLPWVEGLRLWLHPKDDTTDVIFRTGLFEPNEMTWFAETVRPGMTVVDVGANCGLYTMLASRRVGPSGRVVAIEASPREQARLREHVALNGLANVAVVPAAAADRPGRATLRVANWPNSGQNTLGDFIYRGVKSAETREVEVTTVDRVVAAEGLTRVDVLKIDAEGADVLVLRGAEETLRRFRPTLLIEVNDPTLAHQGCHSREIWDILRGHGYRVHGFAAATGGLEPVEAEAHYPDTVNLVALPPDAAADARDRGPEAAA